MDSPAVPSAARGQPSCQVMVEIRRAGLPVSIVGVEDNVAAFRLHQNGCSTEAEEMYLRVLKQTPDSLRAEENLGLAYDAENRPELAEPALRAAARLAEGQKSDEWPFLNLGVFLLDHGRAPAAVPFLEKAVGVAGNSAACHEKLGRALEDSGKPADGLKELEKAVRLDPSNPNVHFELGHAYRQAGEMEKARAEFAKSQRLRKVRDAK